MAVLFFIMGFIIFILLLNSPLVLIFLLASHPEWQSKISEFVNIHKKKILISIVILGIFIYAIMGISAVKEGDLITFLESTFETFGGYFIIAIVFAIVAIVFSKLKILAVNPKFKFKKNNIIVEALKKIKTTNYYVFGYLVILVFIYVNFVIGIYNYGTIGYNNNISIYIILKWFVFLFSIWSIYIIHKENISSRLILIFIVISVIFNPFAQVHFDKEVWYWFDNITALFFAWILFFRK